MEYYPVLKDICDNMDSYKAYYGNWNKSNKEREILPSMWNIFKLNL